VTRQLLDRFDATAYRTHLLHESGHPDTCDWCFVSPMVRDLYAVYHGKSTAAFEILYSMQDGYGAPGVIPEQGYDWSGVRDSTPDTIRRMWEAIHS
jgi:hypothetical protein